MTTATPIITPIIHHNGDTETTLLTQLREAYTAVRKAQQTLRETAPNARNYYPEPGRFELAVAQHRERALHLQLVAQSLIDEADAIQDRN